MKPETLERIKAKRREAELIASRPAPAQIKSTRQLMNYSQEAFGQELDPVVTATTVCRWESGERSPSVTHSQQILALEQVVRELVA
jgi:DNA-binding transcriptional regulator YiaG